MGSDLTITATFSLPHLLSVSVGGTGSGVITSEPPGIDCGTDCTESYEHGTPITLTAAADVGSTFTGWSGACTGSDACLVTMDSDQVVTGTFNLDVIIYKVYEPLIVRQSLP